VNAFQYFLRAGVSSCTSVCHILDLSEAGFDFPALVARTTLVKIWNFGSSYDVNLKL
jgi:hypothetical protein